VITFRDDAECDVCGERASICDLHEIQPGVWYLVCKPCEEVTEMNEGK
jgi:transcription elongation factor Elf1